MAKDSRTKLTKFEHQVMDALWRLGRASVRELQELLPGTKRPAYTTVQTIVYRLEEKGAVRRVRKIGNAHIFEPLISRRTAQRRILDELLDYFGGSARPLMAHLVETQKLSLEDIRELEQSLIESTQIIRHTTENEAESQAGKGTAARRKQR